MTLAAAPLTQPMHRAAAVLYDTPRRREWQRWLPAAALMAMLHAGALAAVTAWPAMIAPPGAEAPPVLIDLSPVAAAPATPLDLAPGPEMQQQAAVPSAPAESAPAPVESTIAPTPPQPTPEVPVPPQTTHDVSKHEPPKHQARPQPVEPHAPRSSAPTHTQRVATRETHAAPGVSASAASATYDALLVAHLHRFKQYAAGARAAGQQGTAVLAFTLNRHGQVLASHLARSSGSAALDADTLALLRRAQPLPAFPPEMPQASKSFVVPLNYSLH